METAERRRQMVKDLNIRIHTFDYLVETLEGRLKSLGEALYQKEI